MGFNFDEWEKEKNKQPLDKQTGTTFKPPKEKNNKKESNANGSISGSDKPVKSSSRTSSISKTSKSIKKIPKRKLTKQEQKQEDYKKFKGKLNISLSDLVINYFDKAIRSLKDLVDVLEHERESAIEQIKIKD